MAKISALEDRRRQARQVIELHAVTLARRAGVKAALFDLLTEGGEGPGDWEARQVRTLEDVAVFLCALANPTGTPGGQGGTDAG